MQGWTKERMDYVYMKLLYKAVSYVTQKGLMILRQGPEEE